MKQGTPIWHDYRRQHINASEVAAIMGQDPWRTAMDVYIEKVEGRISEPTEAMKRGMAMEPYARHAYEEYTGLSVDPLVRQNPDHHWLSCSLDGITFDEKYIVEIKCPGQSSYQKMKKEGIPRNYWIQVQTQLFCVSEAKEAHFFVFDGQDFFMEKVYKDDTFCAQILSETYTFWHDHVLKKVPPPAKYIPINDEEYFNLEKRLEKLIEIRKKIEVEEDEIKERMLEISKGRLLEGNLTRIQRCERKGALDENKMINSGIKLDDFRKSATTYQKIVFKTKDSF